MARATVSGVPTRALEFPAPPVTAAVRVHSARSNRSPPAAIAISRCEPVFSGLPAGRRLAPQAVDVGLGAAGLVGGGRGAAERQPGPRLLHREHVADEVSELVVR